MEQKEQTVDEIIRRGEILFNEGRLEEAEKYFLSLLPQYPSESNIKNNLGTIRFLQGDIITAKEYFLSALAANENNEDALSNLKELYRNYGVWEDYPQSLLNATTPTVFFEEAFKLDPKDPGVQNDVGIIQLNSGHILEAEQSFRTAINLDQTYQEAFYNLGKTLMLQERYVEAIDNFIATIILIPESEIAKKAALEYQNDEIIKKISNKYKNILIVLEEGISNLDMLTPTLKAIKELHPAGSITIFCCEPAIKAVERSEYIDQFITKPDDQSYDLAMLTIASTNIISNLKTWFDSHCKQTFLSNPLKDNNESYNYFHMARCLGHFKDKPFMAHHFGNQNEKTFDRQLKHQNQRAIFLGGTGRSGTTLITRILNRHRDLAAFGEVKVVMSGIDDLLQLFKQSQISRKTAFDAFKKKWTQEYYEFLVPWKPKNGNDHRRGLVRFFSQEEVFECLPLLDHLNIFQSPQSVYQVFGNFIQALFDQYAKKNGKLYWAEKTPANAIYAPILTQCFSDMKIVNIVRDGRDVACSLMEVNWGIKDPFKAMDWWAANLIKALEGQKYLSPNTILNVRYEDLIKNTETIMRQVIHFLDLDWDDNLLSEPVYSNSIKRHKNELNDEVQHYALNKYGNLLKLFNYI